MDIVAPHPEFPLLRLFPPIKKKIKPIFQLSVKRVEPPGIISSEQTWPNWMCAQIYYPRFHPQCMDAENSNKTPILNIESPPSSSSSSSLLQTDLFVLSVELFFLPFHLFSHSVDKFPFRLRIKFHKFCLFLSIKPFKKKYLKKKNYLLKNWIVDITVNGKIHAPVT